MLEVHVGINHYSNVIDLIALKLFEAPRLSLEPLPWAAQLFLLPPPLILSTAIGTSSVLGAGSVLVIALDPGPAFVAFVGTAKSGLPGVRTARPQKDTPTPTSNSM